MDQVAAFKYTADVYQTLKAEEAFTIVDPTNLVKSL